MNLWAYYFSTPTLILSWVILLLLLAGAVYAISRQKKIPQQAVIVALILCSILWSMHAQLNSGVQTGMVFHLTGATLMTLMLDAPLALILFTLLSVGYAVVFQGMDNLSVVALNVLCVGLPAIILTRLSLMIARRYLAHNLFIFIFVNGFFTGALSMMTTGAILISILDLGHAYDGDTLWFHSFPIFVFLSWGEAFLSGLFSAIFIAFAPYLLYTYSDDIYLPKHTSLFDS